MWYNIADIGLSPEGEEILPGIKMCRKKIIDSISEQLGALQTLYVMPVYLHEQICDTLDILHRLHNL